MNAGRILLKSKEGHLREACDEDTRYWIFDDSCEPVGLVCELKADGYYERISELEWETERVKKRANRGEFDDLTIAFLNTQLLERVVRSSPFEKLL